MITLTHLKDNYLRALKSEYRVLADEETFQIVQTYSFESSWWFGQGAACDIVNKKWWYEKYTVDNFKIVIVAFKDSKKKFFLILENFVIQNRKDVPVIPEIFIDSFPEVWEHLYKHYYGTENKRLKMVKRNGFHVSYINEPSKKVQLEAVKDALDAYHEIANPHPSVTRYFVNNS